jgi:hypothetical protein
MARDVPVYDELQFRLTPGRDEGYDVLVVAAGGATAHGVFSLPFSPEALENFRLAVDPGTRRMRGSRSLHREKAKRFGMQLFEALVADPSVRGVYSSARQDAERSARGLRITLYLTRAPELADVPWEFLYQRPDFLAQSVWTPVVRYLDLPESRRPLQVSPPLRILGMVSRPLDDGLAELDAVREQANLEEALSGLIAAGQVALHWLPQATLRALQHEVAHGDDFHVFHYIGHGEYDERSGEGSLVLERPGGRPHEVSGERLGSLLCDRKTLRLAVLNACEAAKTAPQDPLAGVAANLIEHEVPAVVGMQFAITDDGAIAFAEEFYTTLAEGYPVDAAVTEARRAMAADDEIEWGTPVLFMRVADGRLFDLGSTADVAVEGEPRTTRPAVPSARVDGTTSTPEVDQDAGLPRESVRANARAPNLPPPPARDTPSAAGPALSSLDAARRTELDSARAPSLRGSARRGAVVGGIIVALAALAGVTIWFATQGQDPGKPPPPKVADAQIIDPRVVSQHDRLVDYLRDTNQSTAGLSRADGSEEGIRATLRVRFQGRIHQKLPLRWSMWRADGGRLRGEAYNQRPIVFTVEHQSDARTVPVWTPYPPRPGRYRIDFTVIDPTGKPLDERSTPVFRVQRMPRLK